MEDLYFSFDPGTKTCKSPLPTDFRHLLGFVSKDERFLSIHNQEELTNINQQLESTLNLQVSNVIQRVIAQIIGEYGGGFKTIKSNATGALHVSVQEDPVSSKTPYNATINFATAATHTIVSAQIGKQIKVASLVLTVAGETNLTLVSGTTDKSGPMDFGGTDQPFGMTVNHGSVPFCTVAGELFAIKSSAAVQVSGYCTFYVE